MKKRLILLLLCTVSAVACTKMEPADYQVIPKPRHLTLTEQPPFVLDASVPILYPQDNLKMKRNAEFLAQYVREMTGIELDVRGAVLVSGAEPGPEKSIVLVADLAKEKPESYRLSVDPRQVSVRGGAESGVFYGIQTLRKSLPVRHLKKVDLPAVQIADTPRFGYRGMMLDVCRHFFTVEEVKTYIDMLALHNINRFHWHLTEDQGWRIEIKKYPELTRTGSRRAQTVIGKNTGEYDGIPHGGFYTQEEIRDIVAYAAERYITIIPEIDMPGHMQAALACYPELGCTGGPYKVKEEWGVSSDVLCAGNPKTLEFVQDVLTEVMDLFPSEYIHVGGDECAKEEWIRCPKCQQKIRQLGLRASADHTPEQRLQSWWCSQVEEFLNGHGRRLIGWDEILEGGLAPNATVMAWRSLRRGVDAARLHHDAIMTPSSHVYFDHYQDLSPDEPLAIGGYSSLRHVYEYEPVPDDLEPGLRHHILGVQANLWTEYIPTFSHAQYMVLPRMDALSEVQWCQGGKKDYADFCHRLRHMFEIYGLYGYHYAKHLYNIEADYALEPEKGGLQVSLSTLEGGEIHYTLDGSEPTRRSTLYEGPFPVRQKAELKACAWHDGTASAILHEQLNINPAVKDICLLQEPNPQYRYKGAVVLMDGLTGGANYRTGRWLGFCGRDLEAVVSLKGTQEISSLSFNTCVATGDWVFDARAARVEVSEDGEHFTEVAAASYPAMTGHAPNQVVNHRLDFDPVRAAFVKVCIQSEHTIPEWHGGQGNPGFVFVDELCFE